MQSLTESVCEFLNNALWDTPGYSLRRPIGMIIDNHMKLFDHAESSILLSME